jgi:hypothetical protein
MQGIDSSWTLFNLPVAFTPVTGPHTAEAVGKLIASAVTPFLGNASFFIKLVSFSFSFSFSFLCFFYS